MSQSLSNVLVHLIFSTKDRMRSLQGVDKESLHKYVMGILTQHSCVPLASNSVDDHIHLLLGLGRTITIADLVKELKTGTAKWIHRSAPERAAFAWQRGYGIFSISPSHKDAVIHYINTQEEHHQRVTFQDEFRRFLKVYGLTHDESYVWD